MFFVCILEDGDGILGFLKEALGEKVTNFAFDRHLVREHYDFVLWHGGEISGSGSAEILAVLDEQAHRAARAVSAPLVATYGFSPKNTLTVAANMEKRVLTLQREVKTLENRAIFPQDIPIECPLPLCEALGASMACIICDCLKI